MSSYCVVCYTNSAKESICCGVMICGQCLLDWALSKITHSGLNSEVNIPCPSSKCNNFLSPTELVGILGMKDFEKLNESYTKMYLTNAMDIRRCPNDKCNYAGVISSKKCLDPLQCPECDFRWQEFEQLSGFQTLKISARGILSLKSDNFSYLNEIMTGTPCPQCSMTIWKDGGCNHMVCRKCNYEFCWSCLQHYPSYKHSEQIPCYFRKFMILGLLTFFFINLNYGISQNFPNLWNLQYKLYEWAVYAIVPNILLGFTSMEVLLIAILQDCSNSKANVIHKSMKIPILGLAILYPIVYLSVLYAIATSQSWSFITVVLAYEVCVLVCLSFFVFSIYASILFVAYVILLPLFNISKLLLRIIQAKKVLLEDFSMIARFFFLGWSSTSFQKQTQKHLHLM